MAKETDVADVAVSGVQASLTQVRGGDKEAQLAAFTLSSAHVGFGYERPGTIRVINTASLGGGRDGIQGGFGNAVAGGVRAPFGKHHGLIARGGAEGSFFGNRYLWDSLLELPQLQLGYQWLVPQSVADLALKGGYLLLGRHNTGDGATRNLGGALEWGGIGYLHLGPVDLRASYARVYVRHGGSPVDLVEGAFCGTPAPFALCTSLRYERGDVGLPDGTLRDVSVSYVGITIGLVEFETLPTKKEKKQ